MRFVSAVLAILLIVTTGLTGQGVERNHPWEKLQNGKGWILLYLAKAQRDPRFLWLKRSGEVESVPNFEIVQTKRQWVKAGDTLILKNYPSRIDIVDFANFGESRVEEMPPAQHLPWQKSWETGVYLPIGEPVRVLRVDVGPIGPGGLRAVYALVTRQFFAL